VIENLATGRGAGGSTYQNIWTVYDQSPRPAAGL